MGKRFLLIAACFSLQDLQNSECNVACKTAAYDGGYYWDSKCLCYDLKPYEKMVKKSLLIDVKPKKLSEY